MPESSSNPSTSLITTQQLQLESERMQEVVLLVDNMLRQEETTLGLIVDCMYDIGSVRLIDKKLNPPFLRGATVRVARVSKPLFRMLALRWIKKNCPELLAKWLYSKVLFQDEPKPVPQPAPEPDPNTQPALDHSNPAGAIAPPVASPPPLPDAVEAVTIPGEGSPIAPPIDHQGLEAGDIPTIAPPIDSPAAEAISIPAIAGSINHQVQETGDMSAASLPSDRQDLTESLPAISPPGRQALMSVEPTPPLPLPAITLEEYNRAIAQIKFRDTEIAKLRTRSYILAGLLVAASVALGGTLFRPGYGPEMGAPNVEPVQSRGTATP
ncbi:MULTISPECIES: hypothetical protein [unclassified Leptolyngbya]|uniref:hypothetical protein n=1 Tax=unclassified Leptolyngbya TaxID=2650499 RepID=UPI001689EB39|nr:MULTISPECIES: hypothetical protein [unclassified Leptolyngbya]MBD1910637.1 hypothetical protein [Leptolyngbya sp. FACHB-8]MBD2154577.1 hypothetical protein [Leptolyngbya sp. FACHB-16]